jgi:hypothetical protein
MEGSMLTLLHVPGTENRGERDAWERVGVEKLE